MCERAFETLSPDELVSIEHRMFPGNCSKSGFLLSGDSLKEIYESDRMFLEDVRITYDQIADALTTIAGKAYRAAYLHYKKTQDAYPSAGYVIAGRYRVRITSYSGAQQCPFQDPTDTRYFGYEYGNRDIAIIDERTGRSLSFNTLVPHMISKHHFFESPRVAHHVNPCDVIDMFEIKPGQTMKALRSTEYLWLEGSSNTSIDQFEREMYIRACEVLKVEKYGGPATNNLGKENCSVVCYMFPCELPITRKDLLDVGNLLTESNGVAWDVMYRKARRLMFDSAIKDRCDRKTRGSMWLEPEITEETIQTTIGLELDLADRYRHNDPRDRLTGLDRCLIHPQNNKCHMHIMTMMDYDGALNGWSRKEISVFSIAGCRVEFAPYCAYQQGSIYVSHYIPLEEDLAV